MPDVAGLMKIHDFLEFQMEKHATIIVLPSKRRGGAENISLQGGRRKNRLDTSSLNIFRDMQLNQLPSHPSHPRNSKACREKLLREPHLQRSQPVMFSKSDAASASSSVISRHCTTVSTQICKGRFIQVIKTI